MKGATFQLMHRQLTVLRPGMAPSTPAVSPVPVDTSARQTNRLLPAQRQRPPCLAPQATLADVPLLWATSKLPASPAQQLTRQSRDWSVACAALQHVATKNHIDMTLLSVFPHVVWLI